MNTEPTNTAAFDTLLDQLKCPVCKELLREPFVTGCGHTFCHGCINQHLQTTSQRCPCCGTYMIADQVKPVFALDKVRSESLSEHAMLVYVGEDSGACRKVNCWGRTVWSVRTREQSCHKPPRVHFMQVLVAARQMSEARSSSGAQLAAFLSDTPVIQTCQEVDGLISVLNQRRSDLERNQVTAQLQLLYLFLDHVR